MAKKPIIIIEHLEDEMSIWLLLEYRHSSIIYGKEHIVFTNIPPRYHRVLNKFGRVTSESVIELVRRGDLSLKEIVVLDPSAKEPLTFMDLMESRYVIVGGILGDNPPRGRTRALLTNNLGGVKARNIGDKQYSIDGSVFYVNYLLENKSLSGFRYVDGLEIVTSQGSIMLPYRYPIDKDSVVIADGLIEFLTNGSLPGRISRELFSEKDRI